MIILLDTNVLIRLAVTNDPSHSVCVKLIGDLQQKGFEIAICSQNLFEFWVVATRPQSSGGYGLSPSACHAKLALAVQKFNFVSDSPDLHVSWMDLCLQYSVSGRPAHDARLVALMLASGITDLATLNPQDFKRYPVNVHVP